MPAQLVAIQPVQFAGWSLELYGNSVVTPLATGAGSVSTISPRPSDYSALWLSTQAGGSATFESAASPNVFLRMDGSGVGAAMEAGGGTVNGQLGAGSWETFRIEDQGNGTVAIASTAFENAYLRVDARDEYHPVVNCHYGVEEFELFRVTPLAAAPPVDRLLAGQQLAVGQYLDARTTDDRVQLIMQGDGNLVGYGYGDDGGRTAVFATATDHTDAAMTIMQAEGNLAIYDSLPEAERLAKWSSNTAGNPGAMLVLQPGLNQIGGRIWIVGSNGVVWAVAPTHGSVVLQ